VSDRLPAFLPRAAVIVLVALGATATLTFAASRNLGATHRNGAASPAPAPPVVVPNVQGQAFVFAKGALEDVGLAWRVAGSVRGYAANMVVSQTPAPGTKLVDTGAPLVVLTLKRNSGYRQVGVPEDVSPYAATAVQNAELTARAVPAASKPAQVTTTTAAPAPAKPKPAPKAAAKPATAQQRPPAFTVPGAQKEPLDEMPLPDRARALGSWLAAHPKPTNTNVKHWLYQNQWIVTGAKLGWWRGAEALTTLIAVDERAQSVWGLGSKSAGIARQALAEVKAKAK
jgi:hypothetical protein